MTEGLSKARLQSIMLAKEAYPSHWFATQVEGMLAALDEPYGENDEVVGAVHSKRVEILSGMIKKTWEYGIREGEDRAVNRLAEVMRGLST